MGKSQDASNRDRWSDSTLGEAAESGTHDSKSRVISRHLHTREAPRFGGMSYESPRSLAALLGNIDSIRLTVRLFPCCTGEVNLAG